MRSNGCPQLRMKEGCLKIRRHYSNHSPAAMPEFKVLTNSAFRGAKAPRPERFANHHHSLRPLVLFVRESASNQRKSSEHGEKIWRNKRTLQNDRLASASQRNARPSGTKRNGQILKRCGIGLNFLKFVVRKRAVGVEGWLCRVAGQSYKALR